ncbi:MAG: hypothetical protein ACRYG8_44000 [Janthinobacterium lividum]
MVDSPETTYLTFGIASTPPITPDRVTAIARVFWRGMKPIDWRRAKRERRKAELAYKRNAHLGNYWWSHVSESPAGIEMAEGLAGKLTQGGGAQDAE